jgi:hypothetical protein
MAKKHIPIESKHMRAWLSATGYLFPETQAELEAFERLYAAEHPNEDFAQIPPIDVERILDGTLPKQVIPISLPSNEPKEEEQPVRMVARNGKGVPDHILKKMKSNQSRKKDGQ